MKHLTVLLILFAFLGAADAQQIAKSGKAATEPFRTFELIDARLSLLSKQQDELKRAILPEPSSKATSTKPGSRVQPWTKISKDATETAASIEALARVQQRRYARLRQSFGVRAFRTLGEKARVVEQTTGVIARAQDETVAAKQHAELEQRLLSLVMQYQAISGGYGAAHCSAGQQSCCEPKDTPQSVSTSAVACKWECVASAEKCKRGFTGPRVQLMKTGTR